MSGTDSSKTGNMASDNPVVVLVDPQLGENIGAAARAMLNCGLVELRIVRPRDGWPNDRAFATSSGALAKMPPPKVFATTAEAVADCHFIAATTARPREQVKPIYTARALAGEVRLRSSEGQRCALLFGAERTGLENDDIALSHAIVTIPLNPGFSSLNLAQAVLLVSYEWSMAGSDTPDRFLQRGGSPPATQHEIEEFIARLNTELDRNHFIRNPDMRPVMLRNIRNVYSRADLTQQEVRTLHGILTALLGKKGPPRHDDDCRNKV